MGSSRFVAVVAAGAAVACIGAPAQAAITEFTPTQTLYFGATVCGGNLRAWAETNPDWPGRAILHLQATQAVGIDGISSFAPVCNVSAGISWRNLDTGAAGTWPVHVVAGFYGSIEYALFQETGPGRVSATVSTGAWHLQGRGEFVVP